MFAKTYQATHPVMMQGASNDDLRDRYLMQGLFAADQVVLNYSHSENVLELLRSLRIGDEISRRVLSRKQSAATRNPTPETSP